ncbi:MmgE/PrpD family protein [Opitutus sp. GAS368]|jgi:2-methylcitrate dehydratase PrpD|uniref:MmgE/PrpD family protein n=1 Tax=Opitutus sp. GAS368 TaxID=1882749 RepID=UPI00087BF1DA|nr:MmgE/PrpD family protein [Opitutus sp. GAS368]SDR68114.1 2-methylcitrate dehydratase PrpD [Opitutus sp. GAS368]
MHRRNFIKSAIGAGAAYSVLGPASAVAAEPASLPAAGGELPFQVRSDITPYVARFIAEAQYADLPAEVIELGKKSLLDAFGLALVGGKSRGGHLLRTYFDSLGCAPGGVRILGTTARLPLRFAAFANGVSIHMEDFDDTQLAVAKDRVYGQLMHPTAPVFPAALGTADTMHVSGKEFMLGYHVGIEVACKLAEACSPRAYKNGFHSTGTFGVFGSMAACAKLRGYNAGLICQAMPIAASQASGLSQNFGTLTKPFHAGHAAEAGVIASDLAALGWDGAENILEAQNGFFHAYGGSYDADSLLNKLGRPWTFASPGVSIKPYPSGSLTHPGMTEMARLIRTEGIKAADVVQVEVGTNSQMPKSLHNHTPKKGLEAKFSMEYCMAVLLVAGKAGLGEFTDAVVSRPEMQEMIGRVRFYVDPEAEAAGYSKMTTILKIHLKDGRTISGKADFAKGSPANPMSYDEVAEKFQGCAAYAGWPEAKARQIIEGVKHLEDLPDVGALTALCTG